MEKLAPYEIDLQGMASKTSTYTYELDDAFFEAVGAPEVRRGAVHAEVTVERTTGAYELAFRTEGVVRIPCDRCLAEMEQPIESADTVKVRLGAAYAEEEDFIVVPQEPGTLNVAWLLYESVALGIPLQHTHTEGQCDAAMMSVLAAHQAVQADGADEPAGEEPEAGQETDARWDELKKIKDNN